MNAYAQLTMVHSHKLKLPPLPQAGSQVYGVVEGLAECCGNYYQPECVLTVIYDALLHGK